jgi:glycosyltransferase involved in cell wall biosynthesis
MKEKYDIVIAEEDVTGHHGEWIYNVVNELENSHASEAHLLLLLNENFPRHHKDVFELIQKNDKVDAKYIFKREKNNKLKQSIKDWQQVKKIINAYKIKKCIFMGINKYQINFLIDRLSDVQCEFYGVYLHPFNELSILKEKAFDSLKALLYYVRRMILFMVMTSNKKLKKVYILDDFVSKEMLKAYSIGNTGIEVIPDPLPEDLSNIPKRRVRKKEDKKKITYLMFGAIRPQKGVAEALRAIDILPNAYKSKVQLRIIGKSNKSYEKKVSSLVVRLRDEEKVDSIIRKNKFISRKEMWNEFKESDIILMPYQRTEGSSGVLGISAMTETPVIGPSVGPIGRKIRNYDLGADVNTKSIPDLSEAIKKSIDSIPPISPSGATRYVEEHTPLKFVNRLLSMMVDK